ncbi:MAG TPA: hypothetical protein VF813_01995 [Anaerolineaceae bacterium]
MRCDFCGFEFDTGCTSEGCSGCPLVKNCGKIVCPRCGYEMLPEAKLIGWMRKFLKKSQVAAAAAPPERR